MGVAALCLVFPRTRNRRCNQYHTIGTGIKNIRYLQVMAGVCSGVEIYINRCRGGLEREGEEGLSE